jgi:hypothetical protein
MALRRSGDVPRTPARVPTQQGSTTGATSVSTSSTRKAEAGAVEILERERTDKADKPRNAEERAAANEQRALLSTDAREKRALTLRALAGYMEAAAAAPALSSTKTLGAQKNAERAAGSLAEMCAGREPDLELLARAIERSLQGDLDGAEKILRELASSSPAPGLRLVMRNALARIGDAQAALALDAQARALADAHTHLDPKATASKIAADILPLVEKHPHQALAAAALFLEATSAAGGDLGAAKDLIKAAGHAQSRARVPSVATKALPLAQASLLEGNTTGAKAAFHRVIEMSHASASEITAAQIALARIGLQDKKPDDVIAAVHELAKAGPVARGLGALVEASALVEEGASKEALAVVEAALASLRRSGKGARSQGTSALGTRLQGAHGALVGDAAVLAGLLTEVRTALVKRKPLPVDGSTALGALAALDLGAAAGLGVDKLLDSAKGKGAGRTNGPVGAFLRVTGSMLELTAPVAVHDGADARSLGGLLTHLVVGQRGDASRALKPPAAFTLGLDVARHALPRIAPEARHVDVVPVGRATPEQLAALALEVKSVLGGDGPTAGPPDLDDARRRLVAHGWQEHEGTTSLTKRGARVASSARCTRRWARASRRPTSTTCAPSSASAARWRPCPSGVSSSSSCPRSRRSPAPSSRS